MRLRILSIDYHRNGVCGTGFHLVRFRWLDPDHERDRNEVFLGICFGEWVEPDPEGRTAQEREGYWMTETTLPHWGPANCHVAVLRTSDITAGGLDMFRDGAAWRGDHFAPYLWRAIMRASHQRRRTGDYDKSLRPFTVKSPKPYRPRKARKKGA